MASPALCTRRLSCSSSWSSFWTEQASPRPRASGLGRGQGPGACRGGRPDGQLHVLEMQESRLQRVCSSSSVRVCSKSLQGPRQC